MCAGGEHAAGRLFAYFEPVSYNSHPDPGSTGFNVHRGYEADLLTALEAMKGANLTFDRRGIAEWGGGIWLLPAGPQYDLVGGGITILESRSRCDAAGRRAIVFTAGHIKFRQSLLVRATDAVRLGRHQDLTSADRVGVLAGTTGEARLLELTGIAGAGGVLAAGTRVETAVGGRWLPTAVPATRSPPPVPRRSRRPPAPAAGWSRSTTGGLPPGRGGVDRGVGRR